MNPQQGQPIVFTEQDFGDIVRYLDNCNITGSEAQTFIEKRSRFVSFGMFVFEQNRKNATEQKEKAEDKQAKEAGK